MIPTTYEVTHAVDRERALGELERGGLVIVRGPMVTIRVYHQEGKSWVVFPGIEPLDFHNAYAALDFADELARAGHGPP